jgi:hypothetical protein
MHDYIIDNHKNQISIKLGCRLTKEPKLIFITCFYEEKTDNMMCSLNFRVESGLKTRWPKNLSVRRLDIIGFLNVNDIEYLSSIECELDLNLDCVAAEHMYQLLERIGQLVKTLTIGNIFDFRQDIMFIRTEIILERILAACPNLEHFELKTKRWVVLDDRYDLPPSAFKNYKWLEFRTSINIFQRFKLNI